MEIDHNEISGWTGVGVQVMNHSNVFPPYIVNDDTIRIHDNYIHHNQYYGRDGYGVGIGESAYAIIERNFFDWNRHSIASYGHPESGYQAIDNLVGEHGGVGDWWGHTHVFDMHGNDNCGIQDLFSDSAWNCGVGGHDLAIRYNAFWYSAHTAVKVRGTPVLRPYGAYVESNAFRQKSIDDAVQSTVYGAGLFTSGNLLEVLPQFGWCDFDGDGVADKFASTGVSWWFSSAGTGPYVFLNRSTRQLDSIELGNFDSQPGCDVRVDGNVYSGGRMTTNQGGLGGLGGGLGP